MISMLAGADTHGVVVEEDLAPLVLHGEQGEEDGHQQQGDHDHHHHQPAVRHHPHRDLGPEHPRLVSFCHFKCYIVQIFKLLDLMRAFLF